MEKIFWVWGGDGENLLPCHSVVFFIHTCIFIAKKYMFVRRSPNGSMFASCVVC